MTAREAELMRRRDLLAFLDTLPEDAANNSRDFGRVVAYAVAAVREWIGAQP